MNDDSFMRTIIQHPAADGPRLVYADWLEEHGKCERAEFIRLQIDFANGKIKHDHRSKAEGRKGGCEACRAMSRLEGICHDGLWRAWLGDFPIRRYGAVFIRGFVQGYSVSWERFLRFCSWPSGHVKFERIRKEAPLFNHIRLTTMPCNFTQIVEGEELPNLVEGDGTMGYRVERMSARMNVSIYRAPELWSRRRIDRNAEEARQRYNRFANGAGRQILGTREMPGLVYTNVNLDRFMVQILQDRWPTVQFNCPPAHAQFRTSRYEIVIVQNPAVPYERVTRDFMVGLSDIERLVQAGEPVTAAVRWHPAQRRGARRRASL